MRIGIIGAGKIGGTLAARLAELGHDVSIANSRGPETLADVTAETGARATTVQDAAHDGQLVVVTIPLKAVPELPAGLFADAGETIVVDTCNYYPGRDGRIEELERGMSSSAWVQRQLGHPVVKAFNTIYFRHLADNGTPPGTPGRRALPVAGDEGSGKERLMKLIDELGFDPVDAGSIIESWRQEPDQPVYNAELDAEAARRALAAATPLRPA